MIPHLACPVHESSQIGDARRQAVRLAEGLGFDELAQGRVALVATELATNLVRHAREGLLLIGRHAVDHVATIELISIDGGPGMANVERSMVDGVSTAGTSGNGLGAVQRISSQLLMFSKVGFGTVIVARLTADNSELRAPREPADALRHAGICVAAPGETVSGDGWISHRNGASVSVLVADGLGHGPGAAEAADAAMAVFSQRADEGPRDIVERCHTALRATRGAAISVLKIDLGSRSLAFCGAGNVAARLLNGTDDRTLLSQHGTVGLQVRKLQELQYDLPDHAVVIVHTDGIVTRWDLNDVKELLSHDPIMLAAHLVKNKLRGKDDATVVVVQCG